MHAPVARAQDLLALRVEAAGFDSQAMRRTAGAWEVWDCILLGPQPKRAQFP